MAQFASLVSGARGWGGGGAQTLIPEQSWLSAAVREELAVVMRHHFGGPSWVTTMIVTIVAIVVVAGLIFLGIRVAQSGTKTKKFI